MSSALLALGALGPGLFNSANALEAFAGAWGLLAAFASQSGRTVVELDVVPVGSAMVGWKSFSMWSESSSSRKALGRLTRFTPRPEALEALVPWPPPVGALSWPLVRAMAESQESVRTRLAIHVTHGQTTKLHLRSLKRISVTNSEGLHRKFNQSFKHVCNKHSAIATQRIHRQTHSSSL